MESESKAANWHAMNRNFSRAAMMDAGWNSTKHHYLRGDVGPMNFAIWGPNPCRQLEIDTIVLIPIDPSALASRDHAITVQKHWLAGNRKINHM